MQKAAWALILALLRAGNKSAARIAMMAITTRSSISVKSWRDFDRNFTWQRCDLLLRELEPVKLLGAGDRIGYDILPIDDGW